jgi:hypothetical protein
MAGELDDLIGERGKTHGDYAAVADTYATLLAAWQSSGQPLPETSALALTMIFVKIARILNGDPSHADHWIDIAGYAKLVADHLSHGPDQTH